MAQRHLKALGLLFSDDRHPGSELVADVCKHSNGNEYLESVLSSILSAVQADLADERKLLTAAVEATKAANAVSEFAGNSIIDAHWHLEFARTSTGIKIIRHWRDDGRPLAKLAYLLKEGPKRTVVGAKLGTMKWMAWVGEPEVLTVDNPAHVFSYS